MPLVIIPEKARLEWFERKLEISVEIIKIKKLLKVPYLEQVWMKGFQGVVHGHFSHNTRPKLSLSSFGMECKVSAWAHDLRLPGPLQYL